MLINESISLYATDSLILYSFHFFIISNLIISFLLSSIYSPQGFYLEPISSSHIMFYHLISSDLPHILAMLSYSHIVIISKIIMHADMDQIHSLLSHSITSLLSLNLIMKSLKNDSTLTSHENYCLNQI